MDLNFSQRIQEEEETVNFTNRVKQDNAPGTLNFSSRISDELDIQEEPTSLEESLDEVKVTPPTTETYEPPFAKYGEGELTKEAALQDPDIMQLMRDGLELRYGSRSTLRGTATAVLGGATASYSSDLSDEEVYEQWQNWQRSFAGGQTVTTANEVAFNSTLNEEEKALLGAQYLMFDKNPNIFNAKVSWGEMFDGMGDYAKAAIWDPTTVLSFGVGKVLGAGGSKVAAQAVRTASVSAFKEAMKKGVGKEAAKKVAQDTAKSVFLKTKAKDMAAYTAVDFVANIGSDVLYQNQLIDTGAQDDYSATQTAIAGLATIMLPAIVESSRGFARFANSDKAPAPLKAALDLSEQFKGQTKEVIDRQLQARIDWDLVDSQFSDTVENFSDNRKYHLQWGKAKEEASEIFKDDITLEANENIFWKSFLFGDTEGKSKGFVQTMSEAGLVFVKRSEDDNITNFIGDAISWMPDEQVSRFVKGYQKEFGEIDALKGVETSEDLMAFWKLRQSEVGSRLWDSRQSKVLLTNGVSDASTAGDLAKALAIEGNPEVKDKERGKYVLSLYKSFLTSHPGTTGLNVKGWAITNAANTTADFVQGALEMGWATAKRPFTSKEAYQQAMMRGRGSVSGALRRGVYFMMPEDTVEKALKYMEYNPQLLEKLSRDLGGDSGAKAGIDTLKHFGLDPKSKVNLGAEKGRDFVQTLMGVKLQDEMTKMLSFQSNLDLAIRREYGKSFNEFMSDPNLGFIEMHSPRFKNKVEANALDRTLRETYSKEWSSKKGSGFAMTAARAMEQVSRNQVGGYVIPFGKFFNTSMAMIGDYSGINAARYATKNILGKEADLATEEGMQLLAKASVGITGAYLMSDVKMENLKEGLRWNQERQEDGSIKDVTYDFPETMLHLVGQVMAHYRRDGEVPDALAKEVLDITLTQTFRAADDSTKVMTGLALQVIQGETDGAAQQALDVLGGTFARIASGVTRPLEPFNQAIKLAEGDFAEPDRNTSGDQWTDWKLTKKSTRYIDEFFELLGAGAEESPRAAQPTVPNAAVPDMGKVMGGVRGTAGNSLSERMLASVGRPSWNAFRWGNDAELKNYMNTQVAPIFEEETALMLGENPDFFDLRIEEREKLTDGVIKSTKERTKQFMEIHSDDMTMMSRLANVPEKDLKRAKDYLGVEGDPKDLLDAEGGMEMLQILLEFAENFDDLAIH